MQNASIIIEKWPSAGDLSRDLDVPYQTVRAWRNRGSIPPSYWRDVIRSAERRGIVGVTPEVLVDLHARDGAAPVEAASPPPQRSDGQFTRWRHVRRSTFASGEEIDEHISALRDEWDRR